MKPRKRHQKNLSQDGRHSRLSLTQKMFRSSGSLTETELKFVVVVAEGLSHQTSQQYFKLRIMFSKLDQNYSKYATNPSSLYFKCCTSQLADGMIQNRWDRAEHTVDTMPQHHMGSWMLTSHV